MRTIAIVGFSIGIVAVACTATESGTGSKSPGSGGANATGGAPGSGSGGTTASGAGGAGGAPGAGGNGGSTAGAAGGAPGAGGSAAPGNGGAPGSGGVTGAGGVPAAGGAPGSGGGRGGGNGGGSGGARTDAGAADAPVTGATFTGSFHMGADISWVQHDEQYGATYVDTDGVQKDIFALLRNHGFNSIRLRTFVDPRAADGYDQVDGFADLAHTVTMAQRIKRAGMGFLLAMHYSDNWADPGKQCIPVAWQRDTLPQLVQHVHDYTLDVIRTLKNAGATPNLVQIGNEISPGMLIHICDAMGRPTSTNTVNGRTANWASLAMLLKAGIQAVKEVDTSIKIVLHIDKGGDVNTSMTWIRNAQTQAVPFDVFADTSYVRWQGQPSGWQNTFTMLASAFPTLSFIIPEYGNETATNPATPSTMRIANDIMFNLPSNRGVGAWIYEPEHPVQAGVGVGLFTGARDDAGAAVDAWPVFTATPAAMAVYDQMRTAYAARL